MMIKLMGRGAAALAAFGLVTAGSIALTYELTDEQIERNEKELAVAALTDVLPAHDNDLLSDQFLWADAQALGQDQPVEVTIARQGDTPVALAFPVIANDGYSGAIHMMMGVALNGEVTGLRVVKHRETPGLGDKIELAKSDWILDFNGKSLDNPKPEGWAPAPDGGAFDAFTGATITPRAVIRASARALEWFASEQSQLLNEASQ